MKVIAICGDARLEIPCGSGKQHMRWLALVVATRMQKEKYPHAFRVPQRVLNHEGSQLRPRAVICDTLQDGEEVVVELRKGATIPEEDFESREWLDEAYGLQSNLMECKIRWKVDGKMQQDYPTLVRGDFVVAPRWQGVYPQREFGGRFEIPVEPIDVLTGTETTVDWVASRKGPPGSCVYKFVMSNDSEAVCHASPETLTRDGNAHQSDFTWDVPIAPEPYPEVDSRPSTASSRDGAQVDPRFEQDWESMHLKWVESFMKVRVKDVLTEFYAILIDLFDSYAFMGLDLTASQHTIGMDDWKHLVINCGLLEGQPEGSLPWPTVCEWFEEASCVRDARPYLAQRLTRAHYLELLMRTAAWTMCEQPRGRYVPEPGKPPMSLDEGLFRFITDILIPVMDIYDDDPIRKDAVQQQNLVVIQQNRPSIRSMYAGLSQPWPYYDNEMIVIPSTFKYALEFTMEKLEEGEQKTAKGSGDAGGEEAKKEGAETDAGGLDFAAVLGGDDSEKLTIEQLSAIIMTFNGTVEKITANHPGPFEQRGLHFWEFFEVVMQSCRELDSNTGTALSEAIPAFVQTVVAFLGLVDQGHVMLPDPPSTDVGDSRTEEDQGA